ncbi:hypothetical protein LTR78_003878 [Recurvomyces mirabilis]|uniref:Uncharacterized protein n=1 Tax=Recurvomyces mirabilis TaxID=574656 RepID=A0AAE0WR50_9PEZI|nr:hypothetical protein LTR78_003878 [Recurvomyces mirabilis]KAK5153983.1 hypothetical protein LTS14_007203 [Recurvomyces mirabilis]
MRLFDLPPPLIGQIAILLVSASPGTAEFLNFSTTSTTLTSEVNVGSYIVSGLGGATETLDTTSTPLPVATSTGFDYASSCNAASYSYSSASSAYGNDHYYNVTNTTTFEYTYTTAPAPPSSHATSLTSLCDGYPRVVGKATISNASSRVVTSATTYPVTYSVAATDYTSPSPSCYIGTRDCSLLWNSYSTSLSSAAAQTDGYYDNPPLCETNTATTTSATTCTDCQIVAASARLLYWPVTTVPGTGDLCNKSAETITKTPTGPPSSFVTAGITITSPTVALSFGGLQRQDDCGATTDTIVAVNPDEVFTVRGYHALFSHYSFNYADLNYRCASNTSNTSGTPDWERDDCYQAVPADAYFAGLQEASNNYMRQNGTEGLTIWPDYHPQVMVPDTMMPAISSIWGKGCIIHPLGVWDPPVALTQQSEIDGVTTPAHAPATTTTSEDPGVTASGPVKLNPQETAVGPTTPTQPSPTTSSTSMSVVTAAYPQVASTQTKLVGPGSDSESSTTIILAPSPIIAVTGTKLSVPGEDSASPVTAYSPAIAVTGTKLIVSGGGSADPGTTSSPSPNKESAAGVLVSILGGSSQQDAVQQASRPQDPGQASQGPASAVMSILGDDAQARQSQVANDPAAGGVSQAIGAGGAHAPINQQGSTISAIQDPASASLSQVIAFGSQTATVTRPTSSPGVAILADITLSEGGPAATISGHSVSVATGGVVLVDGVTASAASLSGHSNTGSAGSAGSATTSNGSSTSLSDLPTTNRVSGSQTGPGAANPSSATGASASGTTNSSSTDEKWSMFGMSAVMAAIMAAIMAVIVL